MSYQETLDLVGYLGWARVCTLTYKANSFFSTYRKTNKEWLTINYCNSFSNSNEYSTCTGYECRGGMNKRGFKYKELEFT